jgi:hypothetical protein
LAPFLAPQGERWLAKQAGEGGLHPLIRVRSPARQATARPPTTINGFVIQLSATP